MPVLANWLVAPNARGVGRNDLVRDGAKLLVWMMADDAKHSQATKVCGFPLCSKLMIATAY